MYIFYRLESELLYIYYLHHFYYIWLMAVNFICIFYCKTNEFKWVDMYYTEIAPCAKFCVSMKHYSDLI